MSITASESEHAHTTSLENLAVAARDSARVSGLTHNFYRYPARFSPVFAQAAIETFSRPGDWVLDPFAGGGTTLVEALACGRNAIGSDVSTLATFVCEAKTTILTKREIDIVRRWISRLPDIINMQSPGRRFSPYADRGYYRNLEGSDYWRLRKAIEQVLDSISRLRSARAQILARCILLQTSQWALDARKNRPTIGQFRDRICLKGEEMLVAAEEFRQRVRCNSSGMRAKVHCLNGSAGELASHPVIRRAGAPKLVLTSPPYPGIRVLYHRWQIDGRKSCLAPFWIANRMDGAGEPHYTMGGVAKDRLSLQRYFDNLARNFASIAQICGDSSVVVQMVAFSQPKWQLPRYLEVMTQSGLTEILRSNTKKTDGADRIWRQVPNRKWHTHREKCTSGAREVVLIHRKS
ncbi:MAG: site-specific DNA-methyltransferase [Alphaproteobacteria bacterium]|nr:site-specific DNA-methyltransferase [Alphaproteobacteria bacterium]MDA8003480.1 site-specific DNA-methyltransferase [Alphaproteobacteria bacterium]MDA8005132.1 site-specific DNA-methyltransferase [Alphaproteobacteria bacterium]